MKKASVLFSALATALALAVPVGAAPTLQVSDDRAPYVVLLTADPVVAYEGEIPGLPATKPGKGQKVDPNSPAVRAYQRHLDKERGNARAGAGIDPAQVLNIYDFALAGFSALLTPGEAEDLRTQKGVRSVMRDELKQLHTDTSGDFLGLTAPGGAYDSGLDG